MTKRHITALVAATVSMGVAIYEHDRAKYWEAKRGRFASWMPELMCERYPGMTDGWRLANQYAVPGTGKRTYGRWLRMPRHASVKRTLMSVYDSLRGVTVPPSSYDDIPRSNIYDRSWKRFRRTRWRDRSVVLSEVTCRQP